MSIASRIENMYDNVGKAYKNIEDLGIDLTNVDKNLENLSTKIGEIYNDLPKVTNEETDEDITLNNTRKGKMVLDLKGNTYQYSTSGKNLLDLSNFATTSSSGITLTPTFENGELLYITSSGTYGGSATFFLLNEIYNLSPNTQYTLSGAYSGSARIRLKEFDNNGTNLSEYYDQGSGVTFTTNSNVYRVNVQIVFYAQNNVKFYPMIRLASITDSTYEPYTNGASPNPDYPQDIQVVSGDNTIEICGKNLLDINNPMYVNKPLQSDGVVSGNSTTSNVSQYIKVQENTSYTLSLTNDSNTRRISFYSKQLTSEVATTDVLSTINYSGNKKTFETPTNCKYIRISYYNLSNDIQLEKGSTSSEYEAYTGQSQLISLGVENLFDGIFRQGDRFTTGLTNSKRLFTTNNIEVKKDTTYTISTTLDIATFRYAINISRIPYPISTSQSSQQFYDSGWETTGSFTFTPTEDGYLGIIISKINDSDLTPNDISSYVWQLEKGSKANSYSEYGKPYIELCKIGDYQDYIYKENDKWYLHKEIEKVVLDGSESWYYYSNGQYFYNTSILADYPRSDTKKAIAFKSNYFKDTRQVNIQASQDNILLLVNQPDRNSEVNIKMTSIGTTQSGLKTWLSNNNVEVYYVLATPENILLNDTLQETLDSFYSYTGQTNISQNNNDLPFKIKASALKEYE